MNKKQRWVLFVGAAAILLMLLFPPFHFRTSDFVQNRGYGCLFDPSETNSTVNTGLLLVQWIGVLLICAILWFALREKKYILNYCSQCNSRLQPTDKFCSECGSPTELKPSGENKSKIAKEQHEVDVKLPSTGGWLAFFIISALFIGRPIGTVIDIKDIIGMEGIWPEWFTAALIIFDIGLLALSIYIGIILLMKKSYAQLLAKILLTAFLVLGIFGLFSDDPKDRIRSVVNIIFSAIWLAYFFKSKRVKAVYKKVRNNPTEWSEGQGRSTEGG